MIRHDDLVHALRTYRKRRKKLVQEFSWQDLVFPPDFREEILRIIKVVENPELVRNLGIRPPKGILLYGPPGTGKTSIARVVANQAQASFFSITTADVYSKWIGESEKNVRKIFNEARNVRQSIIFIDELDALVAQRGSGAASFWADRVVSLILQEIDGLEDSSGIFVIGATNRPDLVEAALLRGGRLSVQIEVPLPEPVQRKEMFQKFLSHVQGSGDLDYERFAELTPEYSGADIREICDRAILDSLSQDGSIVKMRQDAVEQAITNYKKSAAVYQVPPFMRKRKMGFAPA
jgi:transitional endoplasmic reticulum ATPase